MGVITLNFVFAQTPSDKVLVEWGEQQKASKKSTVNNNQPLTVIHSEQKLTIDKNEQSAKLVIEQKLSVDTNK